MAKITGSKPAINLSTDNKGHSHLLLEDPDGKRKMDDDVKVEDTTQKSVLKFKANSVSVSPDGKRLAVKIKHITKRDIKRDPLPTTGTLSVTITPNGGTPITPPTTIDVNYVIEDDPCK
jgi:hypothetical protein